MSLEGLARGVIYVCIAVVLVDKTVTYFKTESRNVRK